MEKCPVDQKDMKLLTDEEKKQTMSSNYKYYGDDHEWWYCQEHDILIMNKDEVAKEPAGELDSTSGNLQEQVKEG